MNGDAVGRWRCPAKSGIPVLRGGCWSRVARRHRSAAALVGILGQIGALPRMARFDFEKLNFLMVLLSDPDSVFGDSRVSHLPQLLREKRDFGCSRKAADGFLSR